MIPVSLQLKNFLSYGDQVPALDFTEFDVACLSGNNGHGKSAILDAITWALWGEARKAAGEKSAADGLLRIGTTQMQVELVFDLEGDRYRVLRKFQRKRRKNKETSLEFQVFDESSSAYKSLTEKTIRTTQEKINTVLRMRYETFINSAFIIQGRVDEFTKKTPRKRKEILAEILDLSRFDRLAELAKKYHHAAEKQSGVLEGQLKRIEQELEHQGEYERMLQNLTEQQVQLDATLHHYETQKHALESQQADLRTKRAQLQEKKQRRQQLQTELARLEERVQRQRAQLDETCLILEREEEILARARQFDELQRQHTAYEEKLKQHIACQSQKSDLETAIDRERHGLEKTLEKWHTERAQLQKALEESRQCLLRMPEIEEGFQELQSVREQDEHLEEVRNQSERIEREIREDEKRIQQGKNELTVELHALERHLQEQQRLADLLESREKDVQRLRDAVAQLDALEKEREQNKEAGTESRTALENFKKDQERLRQGALELHEKRELLQRSDQPHCPLCASPLNDEKKEALEKQFSQEVLHREEEQQTLEQEIKNADQRLHSLRAAYRQLEKRIKTLGSSREHLIHAERTAQESRAALDQTAKLRQQMLEIQARLEARDYAQDEFRRVADLGEQLDALAYHPAEHQALKRRVKQLRTFEGEYSRLQDARARQQKVTAALPDVEQKVSDVHSLLERKDYALSEHAQLQQVLTQIALIGYNEHEHAHIQHTLQEYHDVPSKKAELEQAQKTILSVQQTFDELTAECRHKTDAHTEIQQEIIRLEGELAEFPNVDAQLEEVRNVLHTVKQERDAVLQTRGTYENKYERCIQLRREAEEQTRARKRVDAECQIYGHLIRIFGKDGVQAYLIENTIPEIEAEANAILSRLTDNRTHVTIESVKDLQSGKTKETLDIKISDELGTRSYEMYSGGEAFRVDFSIRIALSKLLAKRAGTKLKTLVIDEGFGTQDVRGLEQLVDAIKAISSDFEKILVITHLEALKEAFPVRIEVVKQPDIGSQYHIVH